ncbi:MAG: lipid-A-disaccharide synthase [Pseudomonadota bacterium]
MSIRNSASSAPVADRLQVGIVAGELSGDALGAGLMAALRRHRPEVRFLGVGGPAMVDQGLESLADFETLSVNGFKDPLLRLPALVRLLRSLESAFLATPVDAVIGVDFNVFNLLLERRLKRRGLTTVHYVSPSVYAWRRGRVRSVARAADLLLALYPFEASFYVGMPIEVAYVGHPLADRISPHAHGLEAQAMARQTLGIDPTRRCFALLPGSRRSELKYHLELFLDAAELIDARLGASVWVLPCPRSALRQPIEVALGRRPALEVIVDDAEAQRALTACDAALVKSGTSTLEAMLLRRPMVVSYRLGRLSHAVLRRLVHARYFALPNILAAEELVPELIQDDATAERLAGAFLKIREGAGAGYLARFAELHALLRRDASEQAARAVLDRVVRDQKNL